MAIGSVNINNSGDNTVNVDTIIQEITDARQGELSLVSNIVSVKQQINDLDAELDAIVANVTVDSEVILARGEETTLGVRLDKQASELSNIATQKADKTELIALESLVSNVIGGEIQEVLENELVATDIANKLNAKEAEYTPRLTSVEEQINDLDAEKVNQIDLQITNSNVNATNTRLDALVINSGDANAEVTDAKISTTKNKVFRTLRNRFEELENDMNGTHLFADGKNIFNGIFTTGYSMLANGDIASELNVGTYTVIIPIEAKEYTVTKLEGGNRFRVALLAKHPSLETLPVTPLYFEIGLSDGRVQSHTFNNTFDAKYLFVQISYDYYDTIPLLQVEKGNIVTAYEEYKTFPSKLNDRFINIESNLIEHMNDFESLFIDGKNKFDGNLINGFSVLNGSSPPGRIVAESNLGTYVGIVKIESDKTYTVTKFIGGNRFRVVLLEEYPDKSELPITAPLYFYKGLDAESKQSHTIINNVNAKYILIQVAYDYFGTLPLVQVEEGTSSTEYEAYKKVIPLSLVEEIAQSTKLSLFGNFSNLYKSIDYSGITASTIESTIISDVYSEYDALLAVNTSVMSKNLLGYGSDINGNEDTNLPIYEYIIKNRQTGARNLEDNSPLILITTGIHGNEKSTTWSLLQFVKQMLTNWRTNDSLASLKSNCTFKIIPIVNPGGYTDNTRRNRRNVDLNRNFSYNWESQINDYKGLEPLSEVESVIVRDWLVANNNATIFIDYHNTGEDFDVTYLATQNKEMKNVYASVVRRLTDIWAYDYNIDNNNIAYGWTEGSLISGAVTEAHDLIGIYYAAILELAWDFNGVKYTKEVIERGVDLLANYLLGILNYFNKSDVI